MSRREVRDNALLDRLDHLARHRRSLHVWRAVRDGRDPTVCGTPGGRWDDGSFDVLYTAEMAEGAIAEIHFHLDAGQPIFPSQVRYRLFELAVELHASFVFPSLATLADIGMDVAQYGQMSYAERVAEYPRTQEIAEHAFFLGADGLVVPNARWACSNVIVFCDRIQPDALSVVKDHGLIDWSKWKRR